MNCDIKLPSRSLPFDSRLRNGDGSGERLKGAEVRSKSSSLPTQRPENRENFSNNKIIQMKIREIYLHQIIKSEYLFQIDYYHILRLITTKN